MKIIYAFGYSVLPFLALIFALILLTSKRNLLDDFFAGAKQGAECCFGLFPTLILVMFSVSMLFSSGAVDILCSAFSPVLNLMNVPEEMIAPIILRPFSGSAVTSVADKMFKELGPDSLVSKTACLLMGSTDTIIYTLSLYFSSANIKRTRYALPASFIVFLFSIYVSVTVAKFML